MNRVAWAAWTLFLIVGLTTVTVIDVDGDPTTNNTPPVVLASGVQVAEARVTNDDSSTSSSESFGSTRGRLRDVLQAIVRTLWHPRNHPIRGP
jgi:hypothetical protein